MAKSHAAAKAPRGSKLVCPTCLGDVYLAAAIDVPAGLRACSFCGSIELVADLSDVAELADKALISIARQVVRPSGGPASSKFGAYKRARTLPELVGANLRNAHDEVAGAISKKLLAKGALRRVNGEDHAWSGGKRYSAVSLALPLATVEEEWQKFREVVASGGRFFNRTAREFLDELFDSLDRLDMQGRGPNDPQRIDHVYRARLATTQEAVEAIRATPAQQLFAPPPERAKTGRMNPERVAAFYGAFDETTAIAELRPSIGSMVVVGKFSVARPIRLLDMPALSYASRASISIWDPRFKRRRAMRALLHSLQERVGRPVVPGAEHEYLATQFLAEYLSVHKNIEAVVFDSVQNADGKNIVMFSSLLGTFDALKRAYTASPIEFIEGSMRVHAVKGVSYKTEPQGRNQPTLWDDVEGEEVTRRDCASTT